MQRIARPFIFRVTGRLHARRIVKKVQLTFPDLEVSDISTVIDLGANRGRFVKAFAHTGARIVAVEPNPFVFSNTVRDLKKYKNIEYFQAAVVEKSEPLRLYFHAENKLDPIGFSISASLKSNKFNVSATDYCKVLTVEFETMMNNFDCVTLMKIDIEGGEIDLIDSIIRNWQKIDYLLIETHLDRVPGGANAISKLKDFIYANGLQAKWNLDWE
jgi:FkbM family methyltransferase